MRVGQDAENISIQLNYGMSTEVQVGRDLLGTLEFATKQTSTELTGQVSIGRDLLGNLEISHQLVKPGRIVVGDDVGQTDPNVPAIHIHGSLGGREGEDPEDPMIEIGGELDGVIAIDGSMANAVNGPEIHVDSIDLENLGAIAIDYDGYHPADEWVDGAQVKVGTQDPYGGNTPGARVYEITDCRGDMDNDDGLASDDAAALRLSVEEYGEDFPGLLGSWYWHGNMDCTEDAGEDIDIDWLDHFAQGEDCCFSDCDDYGACLRDTDTDGDVDLGDLAQLLSNYGTTTGMLVEDGNFDRDGDVDLSDLAALLPYYGDSCTCFGAGEDGGGGGEGGEDSATVTVTVEAYDTGGYKGGGFKGEVDHFVFDLKIEVSDPNNDDWVVTGGELDSYNDATFRLSAAPTTPDQYATFVAAPWTTLPALPNASVAGAYDPPDPNEVFTTTDINLAWYDTASSNDGPATVMRIVIDVKHVEGADVSEGFGSVYFSTSGPTQQEDILVADLASGTSTAELAPALKSYSGEFYVKGE